MNNTPPIVSIQRAHAQAFGWLLLAGRHLLLPARPCPKTASVNPMALWYFARMLARERLPWATLPQPASGKVQTRIEALQNYRAVDALEILRVYAEACAEVMAQRGIFLELCGLEYFSNPAATARFAGEPDDTEPDVCVGSLGTVQFTDHAALVTFLLHAQKCATLFEGEWFPSMYALDLECIDLWGVSFLGLSKFDLRPGQSHDCLWLPMGRDPLPHDSAWVTLESPASVRIMKQHNYENGIDDKQQVVQEATEGTGFSDLLATWQNG